MTQTKNNVLFFLFKRKNSLTEHRGFPVSKSTCVVNFEKKNKQTNKQKNVNLNIFLRKPNCV